ncbi:MAG: hypothetical protein ACLQBX_02530 [Candidatus Limnocylindrales bacterium]
MIVIDRPLVRSCVEMDITVWALTNRVVEPPHHASADMTSVKVVSRLCARPPEQAAFPLGVMASRRRAPV